LIDRKDYPLDLEYARKMEINFDRPMINYLVIINDNEGEEDVKIQIQALIL